MIRKVLFISILMVIISSSAVANEEDISKLYLAAGIEETLLIQLLDGCIEYQHNASKINESYILASTFKIPNTLIALEGGVIKDQFETIRWDGIKRQYKPWNENQTLATAFSRSCVWCYQRFSIKISDTKYKQYLRDFDYGWYVGYIETEDNVWFFANHIEIKSSSDLELRKNLTMKSLKT
jgi:beta-lactamase class D